MATTPVFLLGECHGQRSLLGSKVTVSYTEIHTNAPPQGAPARLPRALCVHSQRGGRCTPVWKVRDALKNAILQTWGK